MRRLLLGSLLLTLTIATAACSDDESAEPSDGGGGPGGSGGSATGSTGGSPPGGCPAECPGEQICRQDVCVDPTPEQLAQADTAASYVDLLVDNTAWHQPLDADALKQASRQHILEGDGSDAVYYEAMRGIHLAVPQGHQSLYSDSCDTPDMFYQVGSRFGVCARPHEDGMIVTYATASNKLGLSAGDRIVRAGDDTGAAMLETAARRPVCGASSPTDAHRLGAAAATFFGHVPVGLEIEVQPATGEAFTLTIPEEHDAAPTDCQDPLGRDIAFNASSYVRPDGVAVVHVPRFFPIGVSLPQNPTQQEIDELIANFQQDILDAFEPVKNAPALIWDTRSNFGGITPVGLAIAGGMPTAVDTQLSYCEARIAESDPHEFYPGTYAEYDVIAGGPFAYTGEVAVLIDELDYSAADYFPLAVATATQSLIVGTPTAGAYGGPGQMLELGGQPATYANFDLNRCSDSDGAPLEGRSAMPDLTVQYAPADLASGVDTVMEAAAAALLAP